MDAIFILLGTQINILFITVSFFSFDMVSFRNSSFSIQCLYQSWYPELMNWSVVGVGFYIGSLILDRRPT